MTTKPIALNAPAAATKAAPQSTEAAKPLPAVILDLAQAKPVAHNLIDESSLNPRRDFDPVKLAELAEQVARDGVLQPILLRPHPKKPGRLEIVAGARRWRAVELLIKAGRAPADYPMPAVVRPLDDKTVLRLSLVENIQRQDLNPMEEADRIALMVKSGITVDQIAADIGKTDRWVEKRLALTKKLTNDVQASLREGVITVRQAEAVAKAAPARQKNLVADIKRGYLATEASITERVTRDLPPVGIAHFKLDDYKGEIIDGETQRSGKPERFFADVAQFEKLQSAAITATRDRLQKEGWAWLEICSRERGDLFYEHNFGRSTDKAKAGAVIEINYDGKVIVHTGLTKRAPAGDPRRAPTGKTTNGRKAANEPPVTQALLVYAKHRKTEALQSAILADAVGNGSGGNGARMAKILTCLALMGDSENVAIANSKLGQQDGIIAPEVRKALDKARGPLAGLIASAPKTGTAERYRDDDDATLQLKGWAGKRGDSAAGAFGVLLKMPAKDLDLLFAALVAARCGSFNGYKSDLGDEPLAIAAAAALKVDMGASWGGSATGWADYLKLCKKGRLTRLVADMPRLGLDRAKAEGMKTAALATAIGDAVKAAPALARNAVPVELQFVPEAEAVKALKAKLPPLPAKAGKSKAGAKAGAATAKPAAKGNTLAREINIAAAKKLGKPRPKAKAKSKSSAKPKAAPKPKARGKK